MSGFIPGSVTGDAFEDLENSNDDAKPANNSPRQPDGKDRDERATSSEATG